MFKQKNHRFCFSRIGRSFFCLLFFFFFFLVFKKKNVGSGLILGSVGLRLYNIFFWPNGCEKGSTFKPWTKIEPKGSLRRRHKNSFEF